MRTPTTSIASAALLAVLTAACGSDGAVDADNDPTAAALTGDATTELSVAPASFDLSVGEDRRFLAGLFTSDRSLVLGGEAEMSFFFIGDSLEDQDPTPTATTTGVFLPVPGKEPSDLDGPTVVSPADGAGVYETVIDLDRPGFWGVQVSVQLDDGTVVTGDSAFEVQEESAIPAPGDPAPAVENRTVDSDAEPSTIDSRARDGEDIPDPELHATTVAEAIDAGRPAVVVVSTPTYCVSQFCGPITETIAELEATYGDRAEFIHLEVWEDFNEQRINDAAAAWILTEDAGGSEPWVFLVGADGTIEQRWDNVLDEAELVTRLEDLGSSDG